MNYKHQPNQVPEGTVQMAKEAFKHGNKYITLRDSLGVIFANEEFASLFSHAGRPAEAPGNLALILVVQYLENWSDREVVEKIEAGIDLKYLLGLEMNADRIRYQALSAFRQRLVEGGAEERLLEVILARLEEQGLLGKQHQQRTDATYILSAARNLTRLELVWETLSLVLEQMAWWAPEWLQQQISQTWVDAYERPRGWHRFPSKKEDQAELAQQIGQDGHDLWQRLVASPFYAAWRSEPVIETWREVWLQQYYLLDGQVQWRSQANLPPAALAIATPHDREARYSEQQRGQGHVGYQVHYTETVRSRKHPQFIVEVTTTPAPVPDSKVTETIQQKLVDKGLVPDQQLVDAGYVSGANLARSQQTYGIDLVGPIQGDNSWQKRQETGYD